MPDAPPDFTKRVLDPGERTAEVLFGLIMVLTFTGSLSIAEAGKGEIRAMLIGALGCNTAWGVIDGVLYLMGRLAERGQGLRIFRAVRTSSEPREAHRLIAEALPPIVASVLQPAELERLRERLVQLPEPPGHKRLQKQDWMGACGVFLWVFLSTFPVAIPFLVMHDPARAIRVSNGIALALLFACGYFYGKHADRHPWLTGVSMIVIGGLLVGLTVALGG